MSGRSMVVLGSVGLLEHGFICRSEQDVLLDAVQVGDRLCHNTRDPIRFNPVTLTKTMAADSLDFQGCSAITLLGTGELLFIDGQRSSDFRDATARVKTSNTWTGASSLQPSSNQERWYPALARLADRQAGASSRTGIGSVELRRACRLLAASGSRR